VSIGLAGCSQGTKLPDCVQGAEAPTSAQKALWNGVTSVTVIDLGIDGSGSMLGFMGSTEAKENWKSLIKGVKIATAGEGLSINSKRVGGGQTQTINNPSQAIDPCFFQGCNSFRPVTSSLDSLWKNSTVSPNNPPLKILISDLEVNDGDITNLINAIQPHTDAGAVIGILAIKAPFKGKVFNSEGSDFHQGEATRPVYILATGPQSQLHRVLQSIKENISIAGTAIPSMKLVYLEDWVNQKTLNAKSIAGIPQRALSSGLPIRLGNKTYSPTSASGYQFAKTKNNLTGILLSSGNVNSELDASRVNIGRLETIQLKGFDQSLNGVSVNRINLRGSDIQIKLNTSEMSNGKALRAVIPRGQLPQNWWVQWDRQSTQSENPQDQTDGLLQLLTSLGRLLVDRTAVPPVTPAASFCLLTNTSS